MNNEIIKNRFKQDLKTHYSFQKKVNSKINSTVYLSNGESFEYRLPTTLIPDLMGYNMEYIKSLNMFSDHHPFNLLKEVLNSYDGVIYGIEKGLIDPEQLFYEDYVIRRASLYYNVSLSINQDTIVVIPENKEYDIAILKTIYENKLHSNEKEIKGYGVLELIKDEKRYIPKRTLIFKTEDKDKVIYKYTKDCNNISYIEYIKSPKLKDKYLTEEEIENKNKQLKLIKGEK